VKAFKRNGRKFDWGYLGWIFLALALLRLSAAAFFPVVTDEAYYFLWSRYPDLGYFDHPPMIAWLSSLGQMVPGSVFFSRLGGVALQLCLFPVYISLCDKAGLKDTSQKAVAACLMFFNLFGFAVGYLSTPDVPFVFFWTLALHEAAAALKEDPRRWLSAGAATSLGLWSKYSMLMIGLVFLFALMRQKRGFFTPWPYLGGLVCLLLYVPHLAWNNNNSWISFGFQFAHGFKGSHAVELPLNSNLPLPGEPVIGSMEERIGQYFAMGKEEEPKKIKTPFQKFKRRISDFAGGQVALWGLFLASFGVYLFLKARSRKLKEILSETVLDTDPAVKALLTAAMVVPLASFGAVALFQKVEANWPAIYTITAAIFMAAALSRHLSVGRWFMLPGLLNVSLGFILIGLAYFPQSSGKPSQNRVLTETFGYSQLARGMRGFDKPFFVDSYQLGSMLAFYNPELKIAQWPGITRFSELTRRKELGLFNLDTLHEQGGFQLLTLQMTPPVLPGFNVAESVQIRDCVSRGLRFVKALEDSAYNSPCEDYVHEWYLVSYRVASSS
jgi:4-amino-4-deoxy-L-arabinose transferase-like glycosyltransferase